MTFKNVKLQLLLISSLLLFVGCSEKDDFSPVIGSLFINDESIGDHNAIAGELNTLKIEISDDQALKQVKVELTTLSGLHQHETSAGELPHPFIVNNYGSWDTLGIRNVNGKSIETSFLLQIPDSIVGGWQLSITAIDEEGNLTSEDYTLLIQNNRFPLISVGETVPAPVSDGLFEMSVGSTLLLSGFIIDTDSLTEVQIIRNYNGTQDYVENWPDLGDVSFDLAQIILPVFNDAGNYEIHIYATDVHGFRSHSTAFVSIE